jgi:23S rRNA pseudouridine2605 synthase
MRINKFLALCRAGSRRGVEKIITAGRVQVNGLPVSNLATDILPTDTVTVDGKPVFPQTDKIYIMLNKPTGIMTTVNDPNARKTVLDLIYDNQKQYGELLSRVRLFPVGRLDYNTSGLLIITNDGDLTKILTHPSSETQKEYIAVTDRPITENELKTLSNGVEIDDKKTAPAVFEYLDFHKREHIKITLHEGRNRQIRRMFDAIGVNVKSLQRTAEGRLSLGNLKLGDWKFIRKSEIV